MGWASRPTPERFNVSELVINTPFISDMTPRVPPPRTGFYLDLPDDLAAAYLPIVLYWRGENGEIDEIGYRVLEEGIAVVDFPRWSVKGGQQDTARKMFAEVVIPHIRNKFGVNYVETKEPAPPPYRNDGAGQTPGNKPGRKPRVHRDGRKPVKTSQVG